MPYMGLFSNIKPILINIVCYHCDRTRRYCFRNNACFALMFFFLGYVNALFHKLNRKVGFKVIVINKNLRPGSVLCAPSACHNEVKCIYIAVPFTDIICAALNFQRLHHITRAQIFCGKFCPEFIGNSRKLQHFVLAAFHGWAPFCHKSTSFGSAWCR